MYVLSLFSYVPTLRHRNLLANILLSFSLPYSLYSSRSSVCCCAIQTTYRHEPHDFKTHLLESGFPTLISNVLFPSKTDVRFHNPSPWGQCPRWHTTSSPWGLVSSLAHHPHFLRGPVSSLAQHPISLRASVFTGTTPPSP